MRLFVRTSHMGLLLAALLVGTATAGGAHASDPGNVSQGLTLFAVAYRPGPAWKAGLPMSAQVGLKDHFGYVKGLFQAGRVYAGGPLGPDHGLMLFYAQDQSEADSILANDPAIRSGTFAGEARPYAPAFLAEGRLAATLPAKSKEGDAAAD